MTAGIIEYEGVLYRTPNVEKFLGKHREMDKSKVSIHAVPDTITNRADIDRTLSEIEAKLKGTSIKDKIIKDGNKTANIVKENYGFAGKKFVEYIQKLDIEEMKKEYKQIFSDIIHLPPPVPQASPPRISPLDFVSIAYISFEMTC